MNTTQETPTAAMGEGRGAKPVASGNKPLGMIYEALDAEFKREKSFYEANPASIHHKSGGTGMMTIFLDNFRNRILSEACRIEDQYIANLEQHRLASDAAQKEIDRLKAELFAAQDALRSLSLWLGVGGYSTEEFTPAAFEGKIRDGINDLVRVETERAKGPRISDSEEMALLRRTNKELTAQLAAAQKPKWEWRIPETGDSGKLYRARVRDHESSEWDEAPARKFLGMNNDGKRFNVTNWAGIDLTVYFYCEVYAPAAPAMIQSEGVEKKPAESFDEWLTEALEDAVGTGHSAWDMVNPREIYHACLKVAQQIPFESRKV